MPTQGLPFRTMALERVASEEPVSDHSAEELSFDLNSIGQTYLLIVIFNRAPEGASVHE